MIQVSKEAESVTKRLKSEQIILSSKRRQYPTCDVQRSFSPPQLLFQSDTTSKVPLFALMSSHAFLGTDICLTFSAFIAHSIVIISLLELMIIANDTLGRTGPMTFILAVLVPGSAWRRQLSKAC